MNCPVCHNPSKESFVKKLSTYFICSHCGTCYCEPIDQSGLVGGGAEIERNIEQNWQRIERIITLRKNERTNHLDYGCGHGMLVRDCLRYGINSAGYDKFNPDYSETFSPNYFDVVSLVEVIEHTVSPFSELDEIWKLLKPEGILYIETGFTDYMEDIENNFYVSPEAGHNTIFSYLGMDLLMREKGFAPSEHINTNVRIYTKTLQV